MLVCVRACACQINAFLLSFSFEGVVHVRPCAPAPGRVDRLVVGRRPRLGRQGQRCGQDRRQVAGGAQVAARVEEAVDRGRGRELNRPRAVVRVGAFVLLAPTRTEKEQKRAKREKKKKKKFFLNVRIRILRMRIHTQVRGKKVKRGSPAQAASGLYIYIFLNTNPQRKRVGAARVWVSITLPMW